MEYHNKEFCLEIEGDYACFTRPEFKVERVSYDVITPSAIRGIFEAILWKPAIRWVPTKIEVLSSLGQWASIRRNEVAALASPRISELFAGEHRQQKASQVLKNVHYRIYAVLEFIPVKDRIQKYQPDEASAKGENPGKYNAMFERRALKGQHFMQPYLGCREFSCSIVRLVTDLKEEPTKPIEDSCDFGFMLFDLDFSDLDNIRPMFFRARMDKGVIEIPSRDIEEVRG